MTQRDIAKDKEMCEAATPGPWEVHGGKHGETNIYAGEHEIASDIDWNRTPDARFIAESRQALPYWIARYEAMHGYRDGLWVEIERLSARISELETLLHPNNRPDVVTRTAHDSMLETVFSELEALKP